MSALRPRYPQLVRLSDPPVIIGHACQVCGRRAFPPDPYGCERCGAEAEHLVEIELASTGTIHAVVAVHRHHHPRPEAPFTVATIVLDDGISLKAVLAGDVTEAQVGDRVRGVTVPWDRDDDGTEVVDLRFSVTGEGAG